MYGGTDRKEGGCMINYPHPDEGSRGHLGCRWIWNMKSKGKWAFTRPLNKRVRLYKSCGRMQLTNTINRVGRCHPTAVLVWNLLDFVVFIVLVVFVVFVVFVWGGFSIVTNYFLAIETVHAGGSDSIGRNIPTGGTLLVLKDTLNHTQGRPRCSP